MAIGLPGSFYDINRNQYVGTDYYRAMEEERARAEYRRREEEHRRMQNPWYEAPQLQEKLANKAPKPDLNDPLAFLKQTNNKLLLTGEAS